MNRRKKRNPNPGNPPVTTTAVPAATAFEASPAW